MASSDPELWRRLAGFEVGAADAALTFTRRLARENRWSEAFARRVLEEYRRFVYLSMVAGRPMTPSDAVDQAWHLHLSYTRSYWQGLCRDVLGRPLHHEPTQGDRRSGRGSRRTTRPPSRRTGRSSASRRPRRLAGRARPLRTRHVPADRHQRAPPARPAPAPPGLPAGGAAPGPARRPARLHPGRGRERRRLDPDRGRRDRGIPGDRRPGGARLAVAVPAPQGEEAPRRRRRLRWRGRARLRQRLLGLRRLQRLSGGSALDGYGR